jgi:hypothetical protein
VRSGRAAFGVEYAVLRVNGGGDGGIRTHA